MEEVVEAWMLARVNIPGNCSSEDLEIAFLFRASSQAEFIQADLGTLELATAVEC